MRFNASQVAKFVCEERHVCAESFAQRSRTESLIKREGTIGKGEV